MNHLAQEPRTAIGATADHDSIGAGLIERLPRILERYDIAVDDDGNANRFLYPAHERPICPAIIKLAAGAAMHSDHADTAGLGDACEHRRVPVLVIPAGAHFQTD